MWMQMTAEATMIGAEIYFILSIFTSSPEFHPLQILHGPVNMRLQGKSEVVKPHLYKYWMMPGIEASTGTTIDFISVFS